LGVGIEQRQGKGPALTSNLLKKIALIMARDLTHFIEMQWQYPWALGHMDEFFTFPFASWRLNIAGILILIR
jgi:hypothetical protein